MWDCLCPSVSLHSNKTNILPGFVKYNTKREIILSIFLTLDVKSYLILIIFWEIVRIMVISEKSGLSTHSAFLMTISYISSYFDAFIGATTSTHIINAMCVTKA